MPQEQPHDFCTEIGTLNPCRVELCDISGKERSFCVNREKLNVWLEKHSHLIQDGIIRCYDEKLLRTSRLFSRILNPHGQSLYVFSLWRPEESEEENHQRNQEFQKILTSLLANVFPASSAELWKNEEELHFISLTCEFRKATGETIRIPAVAVPCIEPMRFMSMLIEQKTWLRLINKELYSKPWNRGGYRAYEWKLIKLSREMDKRDEVLEAMDGRYDRESPTIHQLQNMLRQFFLNLLTDNEGRKELQPHESLKITENKLAPGISFMRPLLLMERNIRA